jgi:hypothetical protein
VPPRNRILIDCKECRNPRFAARLNRSIAIATWLALVVLLVVACQGEPSGDEFDNASFRNQVVAFVRAVAGGGSKAACGLPRVVNPGPVVVAIHAEGELVGRATSTDDELCVALADATERAVAASGLDALRLEQARFVVDLIDRRYALVEYEGEGVELVSELVPTRVLDKAMLRRRIDEGKAYLLRVMDPDLGGVHKYYHAPTDDFEGRLHTIYTASTLYTLLAVYALDHDESLREPIERGAGFLLAMQRLAPDQPGHGAFHYALDLAASEREPRFVVGTTAKTIFTLIELHALTGNDGYLASARLAADWLTTMQADDGQVAAELRLDSNGAWSVIELESLLYTGQVLSALSRLYEATADEQYLDAAARTAERLTAKLDSEGCYLGDDYRPPNPISSSWVILSLFDFARASGDSTIRARVYGCADELLDRQIDDPDDVYHHGRWRASLSSSGNGWLAEVLSELYLACPPSEVDGCARAHAAVVLLFRLLMQYTYSPENSFVVQNPAMAKGGLFWNPIDRYVRTDSVCHAMNAYVFMIDQLPDGVLIELPEPPLRERLGLLVHSSERAGFGPGHEHEHEHEHDDEAAGAIDE